jgi:hypothetical protein
MLVGTEPFSVRSVFDPTDHRRRCAAGACSDSARERVRGYLRDVRRRLGRNSVVAN